MNITKKITFLLAQLLCVYTLIYANEPIQKPIALVGSSYGKQEVKILLNNAVVISENETYLFEKCGENVPISALDKYSLVIIATAVETPLKSADIKALKSYVVGGGHLMLIQFAPYSLSGGWANLQKNNFLKWAGITTVGYSNKGISCEILQPNSDLLKGVKFQNNKENKLIWPRKVHNFAKTVYPMQVVIGDGSQCLVGTAKVGKGSVTYFGEELFRLRMKDTDLAEEYLKIFRNAIRAARPLLQTTMRESMLKKGDWGDMSVLFWNREWSRGERYGPRFTPELPGRDEILESLSADMAIGEYESLQLNLTPVQKIDSAICTIESHNIPLTNLEFLVQAAPDPIPWPKNPSIAKEFSYWLLPPEYVAPKGTNAFSLPSPGRTQVTWLRINSHGVAPGDYQLKLNFTFSNGITSTIRVNIKIYPVRLQQNRLIKLAPLGQVYGDANKPQPALRFAKNLQAHGVEWSLINAFRPWTFKIKGKNKTLTTNYIKAHRQEFEQGKYPQLDLSALDPWMEQAISHGLTYFYGSPLQFFSLNGTGINENTKLKIQKWFAGEISRYMHEKGIRVLISSKGDELSIEELKTIWIPWAKMMQDIGWDCSSTFSCGVPVESINKLSSYVKLWTWNRAYAPTFIKNVKNGDIHIRKDAIIGTYGAGEGRGSEHRKPLSRSRMLGWESWMEGIENCAVNPYFKGWLYYWDYGDRGETGGIGGERFVSYIVKDDFSVQLADCPFWEGVREGMEEGNLCAILTWYLDRLNTIKGDVADKVKNIRQRLTKVIDSSDDAIIRWKTNIVYQEFPMKKIIASNQDFKNAKKEILELLTALRTIANQQINPDLYWNNIPLIINGKPVAAIYYDNIEPTYLPLAIDNMLGITLPQFKKRKILNDDYETVILLGNSDQNALTKTTLINTGDEPDANQSYIIRELDAKNSKHKILIIYGADEEGTKKGERMFCSFLVGKGHWLLSK